MDQRLERYALSLTERGISDPLDWHNLATEAGLGQPDADEARTTLDIAMLVDGDQSALSGIQRLRSHGRIHTVRDLVDLSRNEWRDLLDEHSDADVSIRLEAIEANLANRFPTPYVARMVSTPPSIDAGLVQRMAASHPSFDLSKSSLASLRLAAFSADEQASALASLNLLRWEANAYPDLKLRSLNQLPVSTDGLLINPIRSDIAKLLSQAQDFDISKVRIAPYVAEHPSSLDGVVAPDLAIAQIKRMQRVCRVSPDLKTMDALMGQGIHSAHEITRMAPEIFRARFGMGLGGEVLADQVYAAAQNVTGAISAIAWSVRLRGASPLPAAIGAWPPPELNASDADMAQFLLVAKGIVP